MGTVGLDPPSGTRDVLADEVERRERAFSAVRATFARYGYEPLETPAFERLEMLTGKYGDEGEKLIFKILRRGEHEATGEADLALRYDLTVPLARVASRFWGRLPNPYKRYAIGPVWRADRPGRGRFREFYQCDLDQVGSSSPLADAEVVAAVGDALTALGLSGWTFLVNSRRLLAELGTEYGVPAELWGGVLISIDKLDKLDPGAVTAEITARGLDAGTAGKLVDDLSADDAVDRVRARLSASEDGRAALDEVDTLLGLVGPVLPAGGAAFTPRMVRGLDYYSGVIWEVAMPGMTGSIASGGRYDGLLARLGGPEVPACGGSVGIERILSFTEGTGEAGGRLDVAVAVIDRGLAAESFALAAAARQAGLRAGTYLGTSGKIAKQLKWADEQGARWCVVYGRSEHEAGTATVREMATGDQVTLPLGDVPEYLAARIGEGG
jgi:histidyl-tRNA synthetase